eukprot:g32598.t1
MWRHACGTSARVPHLLALLRYYGPQGDFVRLGLFIEQHSGWSALAFGGNGGMKGAQQFVVRKVDGAFVAEERRSAATEFRGEGRAETTMRGKTRQGLRQRMQQELLTQKPCRPRLRDESHKWRSKRDICGDIGGYSTDYVTPALQPTQEVALIFANEDLLPLGRS